MNNNGNKENKSKSDSVELSLAQWHYEEINPNAPINPESNVRPSQVTEIPWLWTFCKNDYPKEVRSGKWLLFVPANEIDVVWGKIKRAIQLNLLGNSVKVSTMWKNSHAQSLNAKVICIYTYDYEDREDVLRIRTNLRKIGFNRKIPYKTDEATSEGKYGINGNTRISLYYE